MRLLIDGYLYHQKRGMGVFTRELIHAAVAQLPASEFRVLLREPVAELPAEIQIVQSGCSNQIAWEQLILPFHAWSLACSHLLCPGNTHPVLYGSSKIIVIHDLMFLKDQGGRLFQRLGNLYRKTCFAFLHGERDRLCSVSDWSAQKIARFTGLSVRTASNSGEYLERADEQGPTELQIPDTPYLVHIGGVTRNKNTLHILRSFLNSPYSSSTKLVLLGDSPEGYRKAFGTLVDHPSVLSPGRVSDKAITALIKGATASIFLSLQEGFGLPILESICMGTPVIASRIPPMSLIAPEACLLIDPRSESQLHAALGELLESGHRREVLIKAALQYRSVYSRARLWKGIHASLIEGDLTHNGGAN